MAKEEAIIPKPGELWEKLRYYGDRSAAEPSQGMVYQNPDDPKQLIFADFHSGPSPVKAEMIHGKNNWRRLFPAVT